MELKIICQCGQKIRFEAEPVNGRMPFAIACPVCGGDATAAANAVLAEKFGFVPARPATEAPPLFTKPPC